MALQAFSLPVTFLAVQFCNSIKTKSQNPLVTKRCFHMLEPGVRITASTLSPKQCLYCFITVQWVKFKIAYRFLELWVVCITHGHNYCPPGLKSLAACSGKEKCEHSWYGRTSCLPDPKRRRLTDQSLYKRICESSVKRNSDVLNVKACGHWS